MITHAAQITFNDVISVETKREYDDCLEVIRKQYNKVSLLSRKIPCIVGRVSGDESSLLYTYITEWPMPFAKENKTITPASYFIEANRGLLTETKK